MFEFEIKGKFAMKNTTMNDCSDKSQKLRSQIDLSQKSLFIYDKFEKLTGVVKRKRFYLKNFNNDLDRTFRIKKTL